MANNATVFIEQCNIRLKIHLPHGRFVGKIGHAVEQVIARLKITKGRNQA